MKSSKTTFLLTTALAVVLSAAPTTFAGPSRTRTRAGTYDDSKGNSGTFVTTKTLSPGSRSSATTWTNQNGQTGDHTRSSTWNKAADTGTFNSATTLTNGKTASRQGTVTETAPGNYQIDGTRTGFNGKTSTFDLDKTKTSTGSTTTGTITGPKGGVSALNSTVTKTGNGYDKDTTIAGPNGGKTTIDTTFAKSAGQTVKNTDVTLANGKTDDRVVDTKFNPDGSGTRTITNTGANGQTYTRTENFSAPVTTTSQPKS